MTATETTIEAVEVKPLDLKHMAEEFIVALHWELGTGPGFTGEKIEPGKIRQFTIDMPIGFSFLPVARQMADEIKANTCGREKFMVMPAIEHGTRMITHTGEPFLGENDMEMVYQYLRVCWLLLFRGRPRNVVRGAATCV